jgi:pilus assembly protein Flp/PilA
MSLWLKLFLRNESGATAVEYALLASVIGVFITTAVQDVGTSVSTVFSQVGGAVK